MVRNRPVAIGQIYVGEYMYMVSILHTVLFEMLHRVVSCAFLL